MSTLPTVKIQDPEKPGDFRVINESDFDPIYHTPWKDEGKASVARGRRKTRVSVTEAVDVDEDESDG